ncbi:MAG: thioredoxin domain-containing protein [Vicinamibacterales bacterium]
MPNRLARERSPYLLQHAENPVDWYPWGSEAFERARLDDKPIFLSIGYSTCHWCHVMAHESFEDPAVALVLNRDFVSIKLDREERPDVDRVYMMFIQATTGSGGWPMSVWLTPDLKPFFGGTYFPPTSRWGRPGFVEILDQLSSAWRTERGDVARTADDIVDRLREATGAAAGAAETGSGSVAGRDAIEVGVASFAQTFDARHGGFGGAPKFPRPAELLFLLEAYALTDDWKARSMALETLRHMSLGGMRDHLGGGFHRYSVDAEWRVPHFEKMLYDQAQLVLAYLDAAQLSGDSDYAWVAEDTLAYVRRDLTGPDGAFYSAEDADSAVPSETAPTAASGQDASVPASHAHAEKKEGAFYIWTLGEITKLLGDDAPVVTRRFGVELQGNALADPQGEFRGQNILYVAQTIDDVAARSGRAVGEVTSALDRAQQRLLEARSARPRPHLDDKVITAWNGLMIAAFARAARVLVNSPRRDEWRDAAARAATRVRTVLWDASSRTLLRRYSDGEAAIEGFCEDYAYLTWGVIELFQATGRAVWLDWAIELANEQTRRFYDDADGGWFSTTGADSSVLLRVKEDYDGAEPAAASVTVRNLLVLGRLTGEPSFEQRAGRTLERYGPQLGRAVRVMPLMVANLVLWHGGGTQIVIVGTSGASDVRALEAVVARHYLPWAVTVPLGDDAGDALATRLPWMGAMVRRNAGATAFVCDNFTCREPVTTPEALDEQLDAIARGKKIRV